MITLVNQSNSLKSCVKTLTPKRKPFYSVSFQTSPKTLSLFPFRSSEPTPLQLHPSGHNTKRLDRATNKPGHEQPQRNDPSLHSQMWRGLLREQQLQPSHATQTRHQRGIFAKYLYLKSIFKYFFWMYFHLYFEDFLKKYFYLYLYFLIEKSSDFKYKYILFQKNEFSLLSHCKVMLNFIV